jgi:hypothetical protein
VTTWIIEQTEFFEKRFNKLIPENLKDDVKSQIAKLGENPYNSKPLGYKFFREKKVKKWRIYFLIYENKLVIYFIDISDKKLQQETIDKIKSEFKLFKEHIEKKFSN